MKNVSGHIKIGAMVKGMPIQTKFINLTDTYKEEDVWVSLNKGSETDVMRVKLPYIDAEKCFKVSELSFVLVNDFLKYRAERIKNTVYLIPWQPAENGDDLPFIKLGAYSKWKDSLNLRQRAIGYFNVIEDGINGVYDFKTQSIYSINEIRNILAKINSIPESLRANIELTLKYKVREVKSEKYTHIKYLTIEDISKESILAAEPATENSILAMNAVEKFEESEFNSKIKNAITIEESEKFFGRKLVVSIDNTQMEDFNVYSTKGSSDVIEKTEKIQEKTEKIQEKKKVASNKISESSDVIEKLIENNVPIGIAKALVLVKGDETLQFAEDNNFDTKVLMKEIIPK